MLRKFWSICHVLLLFFTLNILWFQPNQTVSALGNETDHLALLKIKESIFHDPFEVLTSWNSSSHFCSWHGVTCSRRHQKVTELNLEGYQLRGFIPPHVGNLSYLRIFNLSNNNFHGKIPRELGSLFRLRTLDFSNNTLEGGFPIMLTNCSELRVLSLEGNPFTGQLPMEIDSLGKLEQLSLCNNNLTGQIPRSIGNLSSLTIVSVGANNLEGNIPEEIGHLQKLTKMSLSVNKLSGTLPSSLYNLSSFLELSITDNQLKGSLPTNMFFTLPNLRLIALGGNQFFGPIPTSITNASWLQIIDFGENHFVGKVPSLGSLRDLSRLWLGLNNLSNNSSMDWEFLKSLTNCSQLDSLDLSGNSFGGPLPSSIGNLSTNLTELLLNENQIVGKIPIELGNLVNLILLTMRNNYLIEIIPPTFGKFRKMQILILSGNKLSGDIPIGIGNLSQLFELHLQQNMLIGNIPSTIGHCKNLGLLDLSQNKLSGAIPSQLIGLSSLSILLNISHNSLSGSLPIEVGMLKNIDKLDVSENYLSGGIPETIGECTSLEYIYLQGNSFQGIIPPSLASLKGLRQLDLSRNNLSGPIPEELQKISILEYFNASFNLLEGEVPSDGVFRNASAISVTNNGKLCGGVPELQLPPCPSKDVKKRKHHNLKLVVVIICLVVFLLLLLCIVAIYQTRKGDRKASTNSTIDQLPNVSYQNLYNATGGFSDKNLIGTGSFGSVYKGSLNSDDRVIAIKVLNLQKKGAHKSFIVECNAFKNIRHRNLVKIFTCCSGMDYNGNEFKAIVFEYMSNGSLEEWLHPEHPRTLSLEKRLQIVIDVASTLHYLHYECEQPIIHCDLKPSNVLLDDGMVAHVSDFGLARLLSTINGNSHRQSSTIEIKGTLGYAPPEYGMGSHVSKEGDMYSYGILLLEMLTGRRPTEEMFRDGHNLHNHVKIAFPNNILEIVDATLLSIENDCLAIPLEERNNHLEIAAYLHPKDMKCLSSLFRIGLACSVESPRERMNMMEVTRELNIIRTAFAT